MPRNLLIISDIISTINVCYQTGVSSVSNIPSGFNLERRLSLPVLLLSVLASCLVILFWLDTTYSFSTFLIPKHPEPFSSKHVTSPC